jgi:hypothetical protein
VLDRGYVKAKTAHRIWLEKSFGNRRLEGQRRSLRWTELPYPCPVAGISGLNIRLLPPYRVCSNLKDGRLVYFQIFRFLFLYR